MSIITKTQAPVVLEQASQEFVEATAKPPFLYELTPDEARAVLDDVQAAPIDKLPVEDRWIHPAASRTSLGPCSADRSSVRAVTGKSTTDRRPAATSAA